MTAPAQMTREALVASLGRDAAIDAARAACWRQGDLSYRFSGVQRRARDLVYSHRSRRIVWLTNRRFGKTRSACGISSEKALAYPGVRIPYAASTGDQVKTFVDPQMLRISNEAPPDIAPEQTGDGWVFPPLQWFDATGNPVRTKDDGGVEVARFKSENRHEEKLRTSSIVPKGCEDTLKADRLRGAGTIFLVVDEARDIDILDYVLTEVFGPMLWEARSVWGERVRPKILVPSTVPRTPDHPHNAVIDRAIETGAFLEATVYDCDHLNDQDIAEAIEECGGEDTIAWQREGLTKRIRDPKVAVLPEFDQKIHVAERQRPEHFLPAVIGDGGFVDMFVVAFGYYDFLSAVYYIEDEIALRRTRSDVADALIAAKERELWGDLEVKTRKIDAPPQTRADMSREEWQEIAYDEQVPTWSAVRRDEMEAGANALRVLLKRAKVFVHPRCKTIIAHASSARWNKQRTQFVRVVDPETKEPLHHYDGAAAFVYFVRDVDRTTNPYPETPRSAFEQTFRKHRQKATEADRMRGLFRPRRSA